jgi:hypothetical protein
MSRLMFVAAGVLGLGHQASGQQIPARDLLEFPIGLMGEASALAREMGGGLWNPANMALARPDRVQVSVSALNSPIDQGVTAQLGALAIVLPRGLTASVSATSARVADLLRTDADPQSLGGEINYSTTILSAGVAKRFGGALVGVSTRYRWGVQDLVHRGVFAVDGGFVAERVLDTPVRIAASTFMFSPTARQDEPATFMGAVDAPLVRSDTTWSWRGGYAVSNTERRSREGYAFTSARYRQLDLRIGIARSVQFGNPTQRLRLGLGAHYAGYTVGIAREESGAGLGASYQFLLTSVFR